MHVRSHRHPGESPNSRKRPTNTCLIPIGLAMSPSADAQALGSPGRGQKGAWKRPVKDDVQPRTRYREGPQTSCPSCNSHHTLESTPIMVHPMVHPMGAAILDPEELHFPEGHGREAAPIIPCGTGASLAGVGSWSPLDSRWDLTRIRACLSLLSPCWDLAQGRACLSIIDLWRDLVGDTGPAGPKFQGWGLGENSLSREIKPLAQDNGWRVMGPELGLGPIIERGGRDECGIPESSLECPWAPKQRSVVVSMVQGQCCHLTRSPCCCVQALQLQLQESLP